MYDDEINNFELTILWCCYGDWLTKGARSLTGNGCHSERVTIVWMKLCYVQRSSCRGIDNKASLCVGDGDNDDVGDDDAVLSFKGRL